MKSLVLDRNTWNYTTVCKLFLWGILDITKVYAKKCEYEREMNIIPKPLDIK